MQGFQIGGKVVDSLGVQELADHKGGLQRSYGGQVMSHSRIIIMLVVQMICIPPPDVCQQFGVCLQIPNCQPDRKPLRPGNILLQTGLETRGYKNPSMSECEEYCGERANLWQQGPTTYGFLLGLS